ncbi:MAG: peptide chain release factor 2, partial [Firmicutes bacterium]|nr:peptide chain release factor 2 [Bacillota bacterium]
MIEFDEYKQKLNALKPTLATLAQALRLDDAKTEIARLEAETAAEGFWNDMQNSQKVLQRLKQLRAKVERYNKLSARWDDLYTLCEM